MGSEPDWEKIPVWNSAAPEASFEIVADQYSGRIPVTRLESWQDFVSLLESPFFNQPETELVFRGHRRYDWSMTPTLGRLAENGIVTQQLADEQLALFRKAIRGRVTDHSLLEDGLEDDELWSIGQHHGLMTPLLDWTYSPYVALFFAFGKEDRSDEKPNPYRAVYVLNKTFVADDEICPDIRVFEPRKDDHGRLVSQAGLFTFSPFDSTIENKLAELLWSDDFPIDLPKEADESEQPAILARYICKIYIRNDKQKECLRHLRRMNVHHASLFPDLIGAADYCNVYMAERRHGSQSEQEPEPDGSDVGSYIARPEPEVAEADFQSVAELLSSSPDAKGYDSETLKALSKDISRVLAGRKLVDWMDRESLQAEIKSKTRALLRRHGYPEAARDFVIANILEVSKEGARH